VSFAESIQPSALQHHGFLPAGSDRLSAARGSPHKLYN
jgi:hypothetical protein